MYKLTALAFLLAMPSCIQADIASSSQVKASDTSISPSIQTQASSNASSNTSQVAVSSTNFPPNFVTNVIQVSTDNTARSVTSEAALPVSSTMNARVTSSAVATTVGSKSISILPASSYSGNVTNVTATSSSNQGSNSTNSVVSAVVSSTAPEETSTVNQKSSSAIISTTALISRTPTTSNRSGSHTFKSNSTSSAVAVTQSDSVPSTAPHVSTVSSAENTSQAQATASKTTIAFNTTQSPSTGASLQSAIPSLQTSYSALPSAGNVTNSTSPQTTTTVNATSTLASAIPTSPEATATSTAILLSASSSFSPTQGIQSSTEIARPPPSLTDTQSTLVHRSPSLPVRSETNTAMTSFLLDSTSVTLSNSSSTASFPINSSSSVTTTTTSPTLRPTFPQEGTKIVRMEMTLDFKFIDEYNDPKTQEYQELVTNLTIELRKVYEKVDGFVGIRILFLKRGSVICSYIVILAKNSRVKHEELAEFVEQANRDRTFAFKVKSVKVEEEPTDGSTKEPVEKLPEWALITMIVLGSLTFIFLVIAICVCVKYRRTISGESSTHYVPSAELGMYTYETVRMSDIKTRASAVEKNSTAQRRLVASHANPTYGFNGAKAE